MHAGNHLARPRGLAALTRLALIFMIMLLAKPSAMALEVWFVRHAESEFNVVDGPLPEPDRGVSFPLTEQGVRQAIALKSEFAGVPVTALYSSTRLRTLQTADAISFQTGIPVRLAPATVEVAFGEAPELARDALPVFRAWADGDEAARAEGGEDLAAVRDRFMPFWQELVARHQDDEGVLVLVTHGGIIMFMLAELCEEIDVDFTIDQLIGNTDIVRARLKGEQLHCTDWAGEALGASLD